jgi:probable O-glycosylation ligase (exosortase A-associated)
MNVPILFFLQKTEKRKYLRILLWAMILFSYPAVVFTYSRGAWIGLSLVTVILFLKSKAMVRITTVGIIVASLLIPLSMEYLPERLSNRYDTLVNYKEEGSAQSRFWNWEFSWRVGLANPLHGGGFNYYSEENYARYYPEFLERWPGKVWSSHSVWFTLFGEHGFPGLFLGVMLVGSCFYSTIRIRSQGKLKANTLWILPYADMLQVSLIAWTAVGTFYDAAYFDLFYYLVAAIVIMKGILKKETFTGGVRLEKSIATGTSHWSSQRPETGLSGTTN